MQYFLAASRCLHIALMSAASFSCVVVVRGHWSEYLTLVRQGSAKKLQVKHWETHFSRLNRFALCRCYCCCCCLLICICSCENMLWLFSGGFNSTTLRTRLNLNWKVPQIIQRAKPKRRRWSWRRAWKFWGREIWKWNGTANRIGSHTEHLFAWASVGARNCVTNRQNKLLDTWEIFGQEG